MSEPLTPYISQVVTHSSPHSISTTESQQPSGSTSFQNHSIEGIFGAESKPKITDASQHSTGSQTSQASNTERTIKKLDTAASPRLQFNIEISGEAEETESGSLSPTTEESLCRIFGDAQKLIEQALLESEDPIEIGQNHSSTATAILRSVTWDVHHIDSKTEESEPNVDIEEEEIGQQDSDEEQMQPSLPSLSDYESYAQNAMKHLKESMDTLSQLLKHCKPSAARLTEKFNPIHTHAPKDIKSNEKSETLYSHRSSTDTISELQEVLPKYEAHLEEAKQKLKNFHHRLDLLHLDGAKASSSALSTMGNLRRAATAPTFWSHQAEIQNTGRGQKSVLSHGRQTSRDDWITLDSTGPALANQSTSDLLTKDPSEQPGEQHHPLEQGKVSLQYQSSLEQSSSESGSGLSLDLDDTLSSDNSQPGELSGQVEAVDAPARDQLDPDTQTSLAVQSKENQNWETASESSETTETESVRWPKNPGDASDALKQPDQTALCHDNTASQSFSAHSVDEQDQQFFSLRNTLESHEHGVQALLPDWQTFAPSNEDRIDLSSEQKPDTIQGEGPDSMKKEFRTMDDISNISDSPPRMGLKPGAEESLSADNATDLAI